MAIVGHFHADFEQFNSAVQGAGAKLRAFEGDTNKAWDKMITGMSKAGETSQSSMLMIAGMSASGREAAGAMKEMETTSQTLSTRMIALGAAVGSFVGNFAYNAVQQGVSALISMGKEAFTSAGHILDLSNKTGLTAETIQRMQYVADQTGGSLEQFTQAAFMLGSRLSGGSGSVQKAVEELGVSFQALQQMRPDQQFDTVVSALGRMDDATKRNELGVAIFGRSFATIAAAVAEGYEDIATAASVSGEAQLRSLDRANDAWEGFTRNLGTGVRTALGSVIAAFQDAQLAGDAYAIGVDGYASAVIALGRDIKLTAEETVKAIPVAESFAAQLAKARIEVAGLDTETRNEIDAARQLGVTTVELTERFGLSEAAIRLVTGEISKLASESDKAAQAIERMKSTAPIDMIGPKPKDVAVDLKPTGAFASILAEETAIREQAEALALVEQQMNENMLVVGQYAEANRMAGEVAKAATHEAVLGYAAVGQQVAMSGDAIRAWIDLQKYSAQANAILKEGGLGPASANTLRKIAAIPTGGGGGGITVNVNVSNSFLNTPADTQRLAETVGNSVKTQLMGNGRQVT